MTLNSYNITRAIGGGVTGNFSLKISVVYSSDDKFAEILGVSLVSLYENNTNFSSIDVYVIDENISESNKRKLQSISSDYNRSPIKWLKCPNLNSLLSLKIATDRGSISQFSRLLLASLLPEDLDKVLYMDCDTIVNKNIQELWNLDLKSKTIAALEDSFSKYYRKNIGLNSNAVIFNSGVILVNLDKWRKLNTESKLLAFLKAKDGKVQQGDQGVLNAVLSDECFCFAPKYNAVTTFFDFNYQEMLAYRKPPRQYYSDKAISEATDNPYIIHYTSSFMSKKPWMKGCQHKYARQWQLYKNKSPWKDTPLWDDNRSKWKLFCYSLAKKLPRKSLIFVAGIFQGYVRPFKNRFI